MNNDAFSGYHPAVNLLYFTCVAGFAMALAHPAFLAASLICALTYSVYVKGRKAVRFNLAYMLPMLVIAALINLAFNHEGATILAYLPSGNPLTLESVLFGVAAAVMLVTVISWFSCFNEVMTSDKFVYLFGRAIPTLSLVLAMALRFVPRFKAQLRVISDAQKCVGRDVSDGNILQKARHGTRILSIMITWALENAIEIADSMKGRGYGLPGRSAFSIFRLDRRDLGALAYILVCVGAVLAGNLAGICRFRWFPSIRGDWTAASAAVLAAYIALGAFPMIVNIKEDLLWKSINSKT
jgi:energy-coupling factor transport system permease protein